MDDVRIYPIIIKNSKQLFTFAKPSESSSVGRASASQAEGRGFESRFSLKYHFFFPLTILSFPNKSLMISHWVNPNCSNKRFVSAPSVSFISQ